MTCIVGLIDKNKTYIGCDSLGSNGYSKSLRKDKKIFKIKDTSNGIIGFTSSYRMGQLLMYSSGLIDSRDEPNIDHKYLVTNTIPKIIEIYDKGGFTRLKDNIKSGGEFLFAYKDKLWKIESDFQVGEPFKNYDACGSGEEFALGSLITTENLIDDPVVRIHLALQSASEFSVGVAPPYYIMNTENDEIMEYKK